MKPLSLARDLQRRKARERHGLFVAEGVRAVEELLHSPLRIEHVLVSPSVNATPRGSALREQLAARAVPISHVSDAELASAADTESPQGALAVAAIPRQSLDELPVGEHFLLLILDAVQDPGNVGTLLRTAAAFGAAATLALPGTVDLWNAKVVRSAMGALFRRPALHTTWPELDVFLRGHAVALWGAAADGEPHHTVRAPERLALVVGNEAGGLTEESRSRIQRRVSIPIEPDVESLNVAVAAGILLQRFRA
ncbi:MAG: TrmH family RNA methyltransferase [Gemmatimonadaceae bacterium]